MRILALNGASGAAGATFGLLSLQGDALQLLATDIAPGRDGSDRLPVLLADHLHRLGWAAGHLDLIAVVVGPGSFTGLRASLALAHGLAQGRPATLFGVTVADALWPALLAEATDERIWCVSQARRDRVFIERIADGWTVASCMLETLPDPAGPLLVGGDAAGLVVDSLRRAGLQPRLSAHLSPSPQEIAAAALSQRRGETPARPVQPLYVDPPEAKLPASRPQPLA